MADLNTILSGLRDALADDTPMDTWANATYGKGHSVYVGIDIANPPAESAYPLASLTVTRKTVGTSLEEIPHDVAVTLGVCDSSLADSSDVNVVEYNGVQRIEAYRKLAETALITKALSLGLRVTEARIEFAPVTLFPYFLCDMELTLVEDTEFGSDFFG
jgi:hypothetical protein